MKPVLLLSAAALLLTAGCANAPKIAAPEVRLPEVSNPILVASTGTYVYGRKRYRRWREDWIAPAGYVDRQWQAGETLPAEFLDGRYTIEWNKRKLPFPGEERLWVRVGKDALLVDKSGRIDLVIDRFYF
jgi:hypothetical protein